MRGKWQPLMMNCSVINSSNCEIRLAGLEVIMQSIGMVLPMKRLLIVEAALIDAYPV